MLRKLNHGEVILKEVKEIPKDSKKLKVTQDYFVIGESETIGNDHRVKVLEDTMLFEKDGVLYIKNESPSQVFCPNDGRHDNETLPPSSWKIDISQEYDYLLQEQRNVAD